MKATIKGLIFAVLCWWISLEYGYELINYGILGILLNGGLLVTPMFVLVASIWIDFGKKVEDKDSWTHE